MSGTASGTFYGVGLGPGDPELLTRKAMRILSEVDWIFYPFEARTGTSFSRRILAAQKEMIRKKKKKKKAIE